jgi:hypothetical protein
MDANFGPEEQVLWPASVLAGVVMCAAVSSNSLSSYFALFDLSVYFKFS